MGRISMFCGVENYVLRYKSVYYKVITDYVERIQYSVFGEDSTSFSTPYRLSYMEWRISYRVEYLLCHDQIQVLCEFFHRRVLLHKKFQNFILGQNLAYLFLVGKAVTDAQFAVVKP